ncbi:F-box/kelch-repeat protein At1g55270-like isoform X2 [Amaranthus tricolor]|uniref:F-box/kelch-repeat protein At1g55270-like isoform X2 n=1 Tax=Amaranthus tricolor TaxID=29722 RepID=UPI0025864EDF|nr:F-box/kelch-repeat protein At1g55270-like isoform X2 [Amaranthus tricolor]
MSFDPVPSNSHHNLDAQIAQLMQCKPLSEQERNLHQQEGPKEKTSNHIRGKVDSVSCYCKVDASLKTVVGARKFVSGSKICIQPDINPRAHRTKNSRRERNRVQSPLLPGLPDDLAVACLIRVPRVEHRKLRLVCKRWQRLVSGNFYYSQRKNLGMAEEWVYVMKRDRDGKISWHAFDPTYQVWQPLPPVPGEYSEARGFGCAVLSGCHLYLFGGEDPLKGSMRRVVFYSARTNKWHAAPSMYRRRHCFGSCVIDNCLYVAGGECEGIQRALRSAEMYDPNKNRWSPIAEMSTGMVPFIGVVYNGKWYLKGLRTHRQVMSEVYDPETNTWNPVNDGMVASWRNPSTTMNGQLYSIDCRDGCKLRVYDDATDSWIKFIDSKLHLGSSRALEAAALVPLNGKLCIIRNNMSISLVDVSSHDKHVESNPHLWENVGGRGHLRTMFTNLLSSIAGRSGIKSHILHCQVLQA